MAYVTARLNGKTQHRKRVEASIHAVPATPNRDNDDTVVAEITARAASGDYHRLLVTQEELNQLVTNLAPRIGLETRLEIAATSLHELNDSQLLSLICEVLHGREKSSGVLKA